MSCGPRATCRPALIGIHGNRFARGTLRASLLRILNAPINPAPSSSRLDGSGTPADGAGSIVRMILPLVKVPRLSSILTPPKPTSAPAEPHGEKLVETIGEVVAGLFITTESIFVHPKTPKAPVGTILVLTKLVMVVVVVIIPGTSKDQL